jgi:hypothetical protein
MRHLAEGSTMFDHTRDGETTAARKYWPETKMRATAAGSRLETAS